MPPGRPRRKRAPIVTEEFLITKEFRTGKEFSEHMLQEADRRGISVFEVLVEYVEERNLEPSAIVRMLSPELREHITAFAQERRLLR